MFEKILSTLASSSSLSDSSKISKGGSSSLGLFFNRSVKQTPTTELARAALARAEAKLQEAKTLFGPSQKAPSEKKSWTLIRGLPKYQNLSYKALFRSDANNLAHYQRRVERARKNLEAARLGCSVEELSTKIKISQRRFEIGEDTIPLESSFECGAVFRSEVDQQNTSNFLHRLSDLESGTKNALEDLTKELSNSTFTRVTTTREATEDTVYSTTNLSSNFPDGASAQAAKTRIAIEAVSKIENFIPSSVSKRKELLVAIIYAMDTSALLQIQTVENNFSQGSDLTISQKISNHLAKISSDISDPRQAATKREFSFDIREETSETGSKQYVLTCNYSQEERRIINDDVFVTYKMRAAFSKTFQENPKFNSEQAKSVDNSPILITCTSGKVEHIITPDVASN